VLPEPERPDDPVEAPAVEAPAAPLRTVVSSEPHAASSAATHAIRIVDGRNGPAIIATRPFERSPRSSNLAARVRIVGLLKPSSLGQPA
jgi:hypothetical protein